jgi:hypothetical protein
MVPPASAPQSSTTEKDGSTTCGTFTATSTSTAPTPSGLEAQILPRLRKFTKTWLGETRQEGRLTDIEGTVLTICLFVLFFGSLFLGAWDGYHRDLEEHRRLVDEVRKELGS